jgi:hypothetical protein
MPRGTTAICCPAHTGNLARFASASICSAGQTARANGREPSKTANSRASASHRLAPGCHPLYSTTALPADAPLSVR